MSLLRQKLGYCALVVLIALPGAGQTSPASKPAGKVKMGGVSRKKSAAKPKEQPPEPVVQQAPPAPPPPQRPYQMAPVPPQVTYNGGLLTISAPNSTLADILNAVRARMSTKVEYPPNASQERVAIQLGPGNPRDVLSQLLQGSPFDYLLLGSDQDPSAVTQIMLMRREPSGTTAVATGNVPNQAPAQPEPADEDSENEPAPAPMTRPTPGQVVLGQPPNMAQPLGGTPTMPEQNAPGATATPAAPAQPGQASQDNTPKTPEQLLQQLQQMQRQEQQRQPRPPR